jgi:hypothetical protein
MIFLQIFCIAMIYASKSPGLSSAQWIQRAFLGKPEEPTNAVARTACRTSKHGGSQQVPVHAETSLRLSDPRRSSFQLERKGIATQIQ